MANADDEDALKKHNFRLCRLCIWPNFTGLGFKLESTGQPPHVIQSIESNSPAAAGGLKIRDAILAVNNQDLSDSEYKDVTTAIVNARNSGARIELLVIEKRHYDSLNENGVTFDRRFARAIETPSSMPRDYMNFPKHTPRTCEVRLNAADDSFGFEVVNGEKDIGAFIQEVNSNSPASRTTLRKCDRILEVDDKFVDNEPSKTILGKLVKGKQNRGVKLYVVDTVTYKYFQDNQIPLQSKAYKKSAFAKKNPGLPSYVNIEDDPPETDEEGDTSQPRPISTTHDKYQTETSSRFSKPPKHQDDIRLCTINRASATDTFGFELVYDERGKYHSLKIKPDRTSNQSNAALAGLKTDDHIIEINGKNIQKLNAAQVKKPIIATKYPEPLELLVADAATYNYYKQQNKTIQHGLASVQKLPENVVNRNSSPLRQPSTSSVSTVTQPQPDEPSAGIAALAINNPLQPGISNRESQPGISNRESQPGISKRESQPGISKRESQLVISNPRSHAGDKRQYRLRRIPDFKGYGFSVNSDLTHDPVHKISNIGPNSPAEREGLRVGDYIMSVNGNDVQHMGQVEFSQFLRTSAQDADARGEPLILEVISGEPNGRTPSDVTNESDNIIGPYPEMRLCTIQSWPQYKRLGFQIVQSPSSFGGNDEYRIQQLDKDSPAAKANIHNGDYIIEVNRKNIEKQDYQYVQDLINDTYRNDQQIKLLVIDDIGYQWYKTHHQPFESLSSDANITSHTTPDPPPIIPDPTHDVPTKLTTNQSLTNGYKEHTSVVNHNMTSSYRPRSDLSKGAIDIVSEKRLLRFCRLITDTGRPFGFQLMTNDNKHTVYNIEPNSPAARAGLHEKDRLIEINDENLQDKSNKDVVGLIRNAAQQGILCLLIAPDSIKPLTKRAAKSLLTLNDYQDESPIYATTDRINRHQSFTVNDFTASSSEPSEPLPRKCVLVHDTSFRGCGVRVTEKGNCDTPIIVEVLPNSPAKRSGLTVGDHIIYIDTTNVQSLSSFNDKTHLIQETFEKNGQITLVTLTGPGYQFLKRRGGYLEDDLFDYELAHADRMKPCLCKLNLHNHEHDFGFTLHRQNILYVKSIEQGSSADTCGIRRGDIILELNGHDTKYLSISEIKDIIDQSKQDRKLEILLIDINGYRYSLKHAIPLNSLLSFVQTREGATTASNRTEYETVYL